MKVKCEELLKLFLYRNHVSAIISFFSIFCEHNAMSHQQIYSHVHLLLLNTKQKSTLNHGRLIVAS